MNKKGLILLESLLLLLILSIAFYYILPIELNILKGEENYQLLNQIRKEFEIIIEEMECGYKENPEFEYKYLNEVKAFLDMIDSNEKEKILEINFIDNILYFKIDNLKTEEKASLVRFTILKGDEKLYEKDRIFIK